MKLQSEDVSLATLMGGAAVEKFDYLLGQVLENIDDPNTPAEAERSIKLEVKLKPSPDRSKATVVIKTDAKFASPKTDGGEVFIGRRKGALVAVQFDPQQRDMFDPERGADITPLRPAATGETGPDNGDDAGGEEE